MAEGHVDSVGAVCISKNKASYASRKACCVSGGADRIVKRWELPLHAIAAGSAVAAVGSSRKKSAVTASMSTRAPSMTSLKASHSVRAHDKVNYIPTYLPIYMCMLYCTYVGPRQGELPTYIHIYICVCYTVHT